MKGRNDKKSLLTQLIVVSIVSIIYPPHFHLIDTRIARIINSKEDAEELQNDLAALYKWAMENNMAFNGSKFQCLEYGHNYELKL